MGESELQTTTLKWLNSLPYCIAENVLGCAEQVGRPDINGCYKGHSFRIELKDPSKPNPGPSKLQARNMEKWRASGCMCFCSNSAIEIKSVMNYWMQQVDNQEYKLHMPTRRF